MSACSHLHKKQIVIRTRDMQYISVYPMLTPDTETPVVTEPTVSPDLLESLQILTQLVVEDVGHDLGGLAVLGVALPVEEPVRDLVLTGILKTKHWHIPEDTTTQY